MKQARLDRDVKNKDKASSLMHAFFDMHKTMCPTFGWVSFPSHLISDNKDEQDE